MQRAWVIAALLAAACAAPGITPKGKDKYLYTILEDKEPELALLDDGEKNDDTSNLLATEPIQFGKLDHTFNEKMGSTALTPLKVKFDSSTTTDSSAIESITFDTNTIEQGIDDTKINVVTNPSIKWSESNDFAETTPKSKRQRGYVTYETENTVTSQYKSDYDNSDPDTSKTKYDARPNNIPTLEEKNSDENNQGEVGEDEHVHLHWENGQNEGNEDKARRTSNNIKTNNSDKHNQNEGNDDTDIHSYWETRTLKTGKINNSYKDNHNEGNADKDVRPYWERHTSNSRKTNNSDKDNEGNEDEGVRSYWERGTSKNRKTKYSDKDYQNEGGKENWNKFPSRNHKYYNQFDHSRENDRKYNYEPRIDNNGIFNNLKGIWNNFTSIFKPPVDKYRRRERYPNSYDSYRSRSKYRGGRKHYGHKDSEDCSYNSPDRKRYDGYYRHSDDKTQSHARYGYRDQKRYRDDNWHEGRRYYNKERNSGRKYYRNDEYKDDRHYGKFAKHNRWRHSKSYSRHQDFENPVY